MSASDQIRIQGLRVPCYVGVGDEERSQLQVLQLHVTMWPRGDFSQLGDDIGSTVDYARVAQEVQVCAAARPRRLIETLAHDVVRQLLALHDLQRVRVQVDKFILPATDCVSVVCERSADAARAINPSEVD